MRIVDCPAIADESAHRFGAVKRVRLKALRPHSGHNMFTTARVSRGGRDIR
jgi:hypothetical protein